MSSALACADLAVSDEAEFGRMLVDFFPACTGASTAILSAAIDTPLLNSSRA